MKIKKIFLTCEDDCSIIEVSRFEGDNVFMLSHFVSSFYEKQDGTFKTLLKRISLSLKILFGNDFLLYDLVVEKDKLKKFIDEINEEINEN